MARITGLRYKIDESPPWLTTIVLAFQQCLVVLSSTLFIPALIASIICAEKNSLVMSELLGNIFTAGGLATIVQDVFGTRLPIIQCASFAFIAPMLSLIKTDAWKCPETETDDGVINNSTLPVDETSSRMQMLSGTIMVVAVVEIITGFTGLVGLLLRFIGPLTVSPTIMLLSLSLIENAAERAGSYWVISIATIILIVLLSECLPVFSFSLPKLMKRSNENTKTSIYFHKLFSVLISVCIIWLVCYILTITDILPSDSNRYGYYARTDIRIKALQDAQWFRVPYPGEWGMPSFNTAMFFGLFTGVFMSIIESIGDYYACGRLSGAPTPPPHAINRGIMIEGFGCIIAGALGTGCGVTSSSENIGAISLTKVGSRRVGQIAGVVLILFGCFGKFTALLITVPDPIIGGAFIVMFAIIAAVGASNLQYADMNSSRNILVFGLALFLGMVVPHWSTENAKLFKTGIDNFDHVVSIILGTSMFVGCIIGLLLDNILPGTLKERGIAAWKVGIRIDDVPDSEKQSIVSEQIAAYGFPFCGSFINTLKWTKYIPVCPNPFQDAADLFSRKSSSTDDQRSSSANVPNTENNDVQVHYVLCETTPDDNKSEP